MCPVRPRDVSRSVLMLGSKTSAPPGAAMHLSDTLVLTRYIRSFPNLCEFAWSLCWLAWLPAWAS